MSVLCLSSWTAERHSRAERCARCTMGKPKLKPEETHDRN